MEKKWNYSCCIVGGGPAGIMLGVLLANQGIKVAILEKHKDFYRDFRGDTIHSSTMNLLNDLGDLEDFLKIPHNKTDRLIMKFGKNLITIADFSKLKISTPFIAITPQWNFLNFLADKGKKLPNFHLMMETKAIDIIQDNGRIVGVHATSSEGNISIYADLIVSADGRGSIIREKAGFLTENLGAPVDVLWFKLSKQINDKKQPFFIVNNGKLLVMIDRGDYWQCAYNILKGGYDELKRNGIEYFQDQITNLVPELKERITAIKDWEQIKILNVTVDRLNKWYTDGLICIGDSAHAMSPIGGVGINLAIQDAVTTANILVPVFSQRIPTISDLYKIQKKRMFPTKVTQKIQMIIQNRFLVSYLKSEKKYSRLPLLLVLLKWFPILRQLTARFIGFGICSEKIKIIS